MGASSGRGGVTGGAGMSTTDITGCLSRLGHGDPDAAQVLWERYFSKLVRLARKKLAGMRARVADEEDVALSALNSLCDGIARHRFPRLNDRDDLWKILVTITVRKACAERRRQFAQKRGAGRIRTESVFMRADEEQEQAGGIDQVLGREPTPEMGAMFADDCRRLLDDLEDPVLREVALHTLEGRDTAEIAERLGCVRRSVERKLKLIREKWSQEKVR